MIEAALRGKLGPGLSRAHERSEDLLTSTAFGLLQYLPHDQGIIAAIKLSRRVYLEGDHLVVDRDAWLALDAAVHCDVEFWPSLGKYGQPDLLLRLRDPNRMPVHVVLVEVKLDAPKSGTASEDDEERDEEVPDPDQLRRYWQGIESLPHVAPSIPRTVVYLTPHSTPPMDELKDTLRRDSSIRLAWLSWRDIWQVASGFFRASQSLPAWDLARLLAYLGFQYFDGFHAQTQCRFSNGHFWKVEKWFAPQRSLCAYPAKGFWRQQ